MTDRDRVFPSKPHPTSTTTATATATNHSRPQTLNGTAATTKPQLYNPARHPYRPQPQHYRRTRRRCTCCCFCFWFILLLLLLSLLSAIAGAAIWVLYRPHRPTFSINSLKISRLNLTTTPDSSSSHLTTALNLTLTSENPNRKLVFFYDPITLSVFSKQVLVANGSFPLFTSIAKNTTIIRSRLSTSRDLDSESVTTLRSDLKRKKKIGIPLKIELDTNVRVKMGGLTTKKVGIRVVCDGIHGVAPKGKSPSVASTSRANCKVDLRIKIWNWTF